VAEATDFTTAQGEFYAQDRLSCHARFYFMKRVHTAMSGTGAVCTAATAMMQGTVPNKILGVQPNRLVFGVGHPSGVLNIKVVTEASDESVHFKELSFSRTSRLLMAGHAFVPEIFLPSARVI
jgi:2-methylaconitate cis-trans-isomerase PrpF